MASVEALKLRVAFLIRERVNPVKLLVKDGQAVRDFLAGRAQFLKGPDYVGDRDGKA